MRAYRTKPGRNLKKASQFWSAATYKSHSHLEKAVNVYPDFPEAQLRLGTIYMDLESGTSRATLRRVLKLIRKRQMRFSALGELYLARESRTLS